MSLPKPAKILIFPMLLLLFVSCTSAEKSISRAEDVFEQAGSAHADYHAPYPYTCAEAYLAEAKKQFDVSDFAAAEKYADRALSCAQDAYRIAVEKHAVTAKTEQEEAP
jgi:hypothetical protein